MKGHVPEKKDEYIYIHVVTVIDLCFVWSEMGMQKIHQNIFLVISMHFVDSCSGFMQVSGWCSSNRSLGSDIRMVLMLNH